MHDFTWFGWFSQKVNHSNINIITGLFVAGIICLLAFAYKASLKTVNDELIPSPKFSLKNIFQMAVESILSLVESIIGPDAPKYFPLIGTLFIFIFINNVVGLIPGFLPPTESISTNLACALTVFLYYNYQGIKAQGLKGYMKHMMGPIWWLAWLMLPIELISHIVRPISLSIRLFGNMNGDHIVLGIFSNLVPWVVPVVFMALGLFVAFIQAFVFSLLSAVYIGLAVAHEDHGHHEH